MGTTREEIRGWLNEGARKGATHMIVACDTFDHEDYPVYVMPGEDVRKIHDEHNGPNMTRVMEVYSYAVDIEAQLAAGRNFRFD